MRMCMGHGSPSGTAKVLREDEDEAVKREKPQKGDDELPRVGFSSMHDHYAGGLVGVYRNRAGGGLRRIHRDIP